MRRLACNTSVNTRKSKRNDMEKWEVVLTAGIEGGSITLYGMYNGKGWIFSEDIVDQTPELTDEKAIYRSKEALNKA
jgi:sucrose-6-phosphate hydrolase SacC (GH32 family)